MIVLDTVLDDGVDGELALVDHGWDIKVSVLDGCLSVPALCN